MVSFYDSESDVDAQSGMTLSLTNSGTMVEPGDDVTLKVSLFNNPGFRALSFHIAYDTSVFTYYDCTLGQKFANQGLTVLSNNVVEDGLLVQLMCNEYKDIEEYGDLITLSFRTLPQTAVQKVFTLDVDHPCAVAVDRTGASIDFSVDYLDRVDINVDGFTIKFISDNVQVYSVRQLSSDLNAVPSDAEYRCPDPLMHIERTDACDDLGNYAVGRPGAHILRDQPLVVRKR